jgi:hypothetical protein
MPDPSHLVCDLSHAPDSPAERLAAYRQLFRALLTRTTRKRGFRFSFDAARVDRRLLRRLVEREAACCPFLHSAVVTTADEVWWDVTAETDDAVPFLDALRELPDTLADLLAGGGGDAAAAFGNGVVFRRPSVSNPPSSGSYGHPQMTS